MAKNWDALEQRLGGFPAKHRYSSLASGESSNTFIWEREWESLAVCEATYEKMMADDEAKQLGEKHSAIVESGRREFFAVLP